MFEPATLHIAFPIIFRARDVVTALNPKIRMAKNKRFSNLKTLMELKNLTHKRAYDFLGDLVGRLKIGSIKPYF